MEIRELEPGDEELLARLDFDEEPGRPLAPEDAARFLADERTHLWVAFDGEDPVGMLLAYELPHRHDDPTLVHVYELGVAASHQRRGIATALWRELTARLPGREVYVLAEESNAQGRAFYESLGLAEPAARVVEYDGRL